MWNENKRQRTWAGHPKRTDESTQQTFRDNIKVTSACFLIALNSKCLGLMKMY